MTTLTVDISAERAEDCPAIERLHEHVFGPGRFSRTAFRLREGRAPVAELACCARVGTFLVGSIRYDAIRVAATPALMLGPLAVDPAFASKGIGLALMTRTLDAARARGDRLVFLVGDLPYYARAGFARVPAGRVALPGPVDPGRLLFLELQPGAFDGVSGVMAPG